MHINTNTMRNCRSAALPALAIVLFSIFRADADQTGSSGASPGTNGSVAAAESKTSSSADVSATKTKPASGIIRIRAGETTPFTDSSGNVWLADQGFADGETTVRAGDMKIANTADPGLYRAEHYSMTAFSYPLPNGRYIVKLHFAETFDGITGPEQRVFSFNVEGREFKDFDVWRKAGGAQRAYIETVTVEITDGKLDIKFTPKVENPEINGIEIIPGS
jgi:endoglucanase